MDGMHKPNAGIPSISDHELIGFLASRFENHPGRHPDIAWKDVERSLQAKPQLLRNLMAMEQSGGEPDVIGLLSTTETFVFIDCSPESPSGRRNLCYDRKAQDGRKEHRPKGNVLDTCGSMGITLLTEEEYRQLQTVGPFDTKTSSWIQTPDTVRSRGGALFGDCRYGSVFIYHNGADSYYSARGFRGLLRV